MPLQLEGDGIDARLDFKLGGVMLKKLAVPAAIICIGCAVVAAIVLAKPKPATQPAPPAPNPMEVAVVKVQAQSAQLSIDTQGAVEPKRQIQVVAQVSGMINQVAPKFDGGGFFQANETLVHIDDRDYQAALHQTKARLADAERALAEEQGLSRQAQREWRDLGNQTANDLFIRKPQLKAATAGVAAAKADVATAQLNLERTKISVPFAGRIQTTMANLGQFVTAGTPIAQVYDAQVVAVRVPLTEQQAALVNLPLSAPASEPQTVTVSASIAGRSHQWQGQLKRTDAFMDSSTRMLYAVIEVQNPFVDDVPLLPGAFVTVSIPSKTLEDVWVLPKKALYQRDKLVLVNEQSQTELVDVHILHKAKDTLWVKAPIDDAATVSIDKQAFTPQGTQVTPIEASTTLSANVAGE